MLYNLNLYILVIYVSFSLSIALSDNEDKIIETELFNIGGSYMITIEFKGLFELKSERINLELPYTLFSTIQFSEILKVISHQTVVYKQQEIPVNEYKDHLVIQFPSDNGFDYHFYEFTQDFPYSYKEKGFGFANKIKNNKFSLVHQLKEKGYISHNQFGIQKYSDMKGALFFGGLPQKAIDMYGHRGICNIDKRYPTWGCTMRKVVFDNNQTYSNDEYAYLQSSDSEILAPENFILMLKDNILKDLVDLGLCIFHDLSDTEGSSYLECECDNFPMEMKVELYFGNYKYSFKMKDFIQKSRNNMCTFLITLNNRQKFTWVLGTSFLQYFASDFDYETNRVSLYSDKMIEQVYFEKDPFLIEKIIKGGMIASCFLCGIGILLFFIQRKMVEKYFMYSERE